PALAGATSPHRLGVFAVGLVLGILLVTIVAWALWPSATPSRSAVPRRLTSNPIENSVTTAAMSADGRYLAFRDGNGLFIRMIETGETHRIETPEGMETEEIDWYPDGSSLLLGAVVEDTPGLWRISVLGGEPGRLGEGAKASFSPDGSRIAYLVGDFPHRAVFVMGPNGEGAHELASTTDGSSYSWTTWSANGDWVLYGRMGSSFGSTIEAVRADGTETKIILTDRALFQNWTGVLPFCWTPDDRLVYALREDVPNRDSSNLWSVAIDPSTLTLRGEPTRLTHLSGFNPRDLVVTKDGTRLGFLLEKFQTDVYVSELDSRGASFASTRRLTFDDRDDEPSGWLSDSRTVLFHSDRAGSLDPYRQHLDDVVPTSLYSGPMGGRWPHLSADGAWILFFYGNDVMRVPVAGGPPERVWTMSEGASQADDDLVPLRKLDCVSRGGCIFGERDDASQEYVFFSFDPLEGRGDELTRIEDRPPFIEWALSPGGKTVAVVHYDGDLRLVELETGAVEEIHDDRWRFGEFVGWDAFGHGVYTDVDPTFLVGRSFRKQLAYVRLGDEMEVHLLRKRKEQWHITPWASPDGRYLAYGVVTFSANAWMLEGF
ncbi:MAG: hypothetical protein V3V11_10920, partial [Vicinamibacteria bacterium]